MLKQLKKQDKGFTIIEVMIVLAIAALIILIVFLAVPALQRNGRNTGRKSDAGRIAAAVNTWVTNNNGLTPSTTAHMTAIWGEVGNLNQYTGLTAGTGAMAQGQFRVMAEPAAGLAAPTVAVTGTAPTDAVELLTGASCVAGGAGATQPGSSTRSMALLYTLEPGTGANYTIVCQEI